MIITICIIAHCKHIWRRWKLSLYPVYSADAPHLVTIDKLEWIKWRRHNCRLITFEQQKCAQEMETAKQHPADTVYFVHRHGDTSTHFSSIDSVQFNSIQFNSVQILFKTQFPFLNKKKTAALTSRWPTCNHCVCLRVEINEQNANSVTCLGVGIRSRKGGRLIRTGWMYPANWPATLLPNNRLPVHTHTPTHTHAHTRTRTHARTCSCRPVAYDDPSTP